MSETRTCKRCGEEKPLGKFNPYTTKKGTPGRTTTCNSCRALADRAKQLPRSAAWKRLHPEYRRTEKTKEYARAYYHSHEAPKRESRAPRPRPGQCEICGSTNGGRRLCYDHDHETGEFRGWLCIACNFAIGYAKDDPLRLEAMARYLRAERLK